MNLEDMEVRFQDELGGQWGSEMSIICRKRHRRAKKRVIVGYMHCDQVYWHSLWVGTYSDDCGSYMRSS